MDYSEISLVDTFLELILSQLIWDSIWLKSAIIQVEKSRLKIAYDGRRQYLFENFEMLYIFSLKMHQINSGTKLAKTWRSKSFLPPEGFPIEIPLPRKQTHSFNSQRKSEAFHDMRFSSDNIYVFQSHLQSLYAQISKIFLLQNTKHS